MRLTKSNLLLLTCLLSLALQSQNSKFASDNIDSLLTANASHKDISLEKAYIVDQIVRYYYNENDLPSASNYAEIYKNISTVLKNEDVTNRSLYRNAMLDYRISGNKEMDTAAYRKVYDYFNKNDTRFCADISYNISMYFDGKNAGGTKFAKTDQVTRVKWYILSGQDNFDRGRYDRSAASYCNASIIAPLEEAEALCRKAIQSNNKSKSKKWATNIYRSLMETYKGLKDSVKLEALEQELMQNNRKQLLNYYEFQMYENDVQSYYGGGVNISGKWYKKYDALLAEINPEKFKKWKASEVKRNRKWEENVLKEQKKKKAKEERDLLKKNIRNSTESIKLPQGSFFLDTYEEDSKTHEILTLKESMITKVEINDYRDTITFKVHRIYPLRENLLLLSVEKENKDYNNDWKFALMSISKDAITFHDDFYAKNNEAQQDDHMVNLIAKTKTEDFERHLIPRFREYYNKKRFDDLNDMKPLDIADYEKFRNRFVGQSEPPDNTDEFWYEKFVKSNGEFPDEFRTLRLAMKNMLIEEGYQPFSSFDSFLTHEKETLPFKDRSHLVTKKLKDLESISNDGILGVWIIERPKETSIVKIDQDAMMIWFISYEFERWRTPLGDKATMTKYNITPSMKALNNVKTIDSLNLRFDIGTRLDDYKVDGKLPAKYISAANQMSPIMKMSGTTSGDAYLELEIDGYKRYMMSRKAFKQIEKMTKILKPEDYKKLRNTLKKDVSIQKLDPKILRRQSYIPGYDALSFKLIQELIALGYHPFKSNPRYIQD